jgi:acyl-CoA-binding protein
MNDDLQKRFAEASQQATELPAKPDNQTMLQLYSFYKQATVGDVNGARPGFTDMVGRAKFDAWAKIKGLSPTEAMQKYIDLVEKLKKG